MKNINKVAIITTLVVTLGISGIVFAANVKTPAEIVSSLTGKTIEDVYAERADGKRYGTIANENGKLEDFKTQMLEQKKEILKERVEEGTITQERADEILNNIEERQTLCDGTGQNNSDRYMMGFGRRNGMGNGFGRGNGQFMRGNR